MPDLLPVGLETALHRLRVASTEALLVSEAPSARAYDDIRIAGTKPETIDPKPTGDSLLDDFSARLTALAEQFEIDLARRRRRPPNTRELDFGEWSAHVLTLQMGGESVKWIAYAENCSEGLVKKALAVARKKAA